MLLRSSIDAAERELWLSRARTQQRAWRVGTALRKRLQSPAAHVVALGAGFVWGSRPVQDSRGRVRPRARAQKLAALIARTALTRAVTELVL